MNNYKMNLELEDMRTEMNKHSEPVQFTLGDSGVICNAIHISTLINLMNVNYSGLLDDTFKDIDELLSEIIEDNVITFYKTLDNKFLYIKTKYSDINDNNRLLYINLLDEDIEEIRKWLKKIFKEDY